MNTEKPNFHEPGECQCGEYGRQIGCICPDEERALRAYSAGFPMPPMTPKQRQWCAEEILMVEGHEWWTNEGLEDKYVARGVLSAWTDYCRDKGLI